MFVLAMISQLHGIFQKWNQDDSFRCSPFLNTLFPREQCSEKLTAYLHSPDRFDIVFEYFRRDEIHQYSNFLNVLILIDISYRETNGVGDH